MLYKRLKQKAGGDNHMENKVLVTYASKYGATKEIAEKIGEVLKQDGLQTDVLPVKSVKNLSEYKAVVIGSGVYIAKWRKEAANFLKANAKLLAERPVWLFSSGPAGDGNPVEKLKGWRFPTGLQPTADLIRPRDNTVFFGDINADKMNFFEKWVIKNVKSPVGDFRDWDAINKWAKDIADALKK
jgi:menaquinone-dependent protoporphyrinogen oxidase